MRTNTQLILALALILGGDVLAWRIQTANGTVRVEDVRWTGTGGLRMSALLYVPRDATPRSPAPGVLAVHGYINSRETQDGFAIELARRGYVVLALDQTGHGYSDPPAYANGFGGPDGLTYLRSLDFVDTDNIGLEGHSMGGWAVQMAAAAQPDGYRSMVLEGSSTGTFGAPAGTADTPRNVAVVFSLYDEFSGLMWLTPVAADVPSSPKLMTLFGTDRPVDVGRVYGSIDAGTARVLHQPPVIHPADHFSRVAIGHALDWFGRTLAGGRNLPASDQIWLWKEIGNLVALVGMVVLLLAVGGALLGTRFFAELADAPRPTRGARGPGWWVGAGVFVVLPAVTLFPFKGIGEGRAASALLPQSLTTQLMVWAFLVAALSAVLFAVWHVAFNGRAGATAGDYGLTWADGGTARRIAKSWLLALLVIAAAYVSLVLSALVFTTDFRFWVFAVKPLSALQARITLSYLIPFVLLFLAVGVVLFGQLRRDGLSRAAECLLVVALSTQGFAGLIVVQYAPLLLGGTLADPAEALWSIVSFQFLPLMTIVGVVTVAFYRRTGHVYLGAFVNGLLVTWIVVAGQATHFGFR